MASPSFERAPAAASSPSPSPGALLFLRGRDADARVRALVAQRRSLRPALGSLALALVERRAYEKLGFRSLGDYARERLGLTARAVREHARVWKALAPLPLLRASLLSGEVSFSAVRRAVALVPPELDAMAAKSLRGRTVRAAEAMVAALRAGEGVAAEAERPPERVEVRLHVPAPLAARWCAALELARRMAGESLPAWEAAEAMAAEGLAALPPDVVAEASERLGVQRREPARARPRTPRVSREHGLRHHAFPLLPWSQAAAPRGHPLDPDALLAFARAATPHALDAALRRTIRGLQQIDHDLGLLLRQLLERRLYRELGFPTFERYAEERADLSPRTARRRVRLARQGAPASPLATAFRSGALTEAQALGVADACDPSSEAWWVGFARAHTLRRLGDEVAQQGATRTAVAFRAPPEAADVILLALEAARLHLARAAGCDAGAAAAFSWLVEHALEAWQEQGATFHDYADFTRDGFRCTAPGCTARRNLHAHHVVFRSAGGPDVPWNRTTLCAFHHLRGVHARTVSCQGRAPDGLEFALGLRAEGPPLLRARSGDVLAAR